MINEYKEISERIFKIVSKDNVDENKLAVELENRKQLIEFLNEYDLQVFREKYKSEEIYKLDEVIKVKLKEQILAVRKELSEFKLNKTVNTAYVNMNKNNLNIFSKKV